MSTVATPDVPAQATMALSAWNVVVVDDDNFQLDLMSGVLQALGVVDVTVALSGASALETLGADPERFNLLLLDLHMPGMDGFQFMEALARAGFAGSLILVSGQCDAVLHAASLVAKWRRFSVLGAVSKPVGTAALSALICRLIRPDDVSSSVRVEPVEVQRLGSGRTVQSK